MNTLLARWKGPEWQSVVRVPAWLWWPANCASVRISCHSTDACRFLRQQKTLHLWYHSLKHTWLIIIGKLIRIINSNPYLDSSPLGISTCHFMSNSYICWLSKEQRYVEWIKSTPWQLNDIPTEFSVLLYLTRHNSQRKQSYVFLTIFRNCCTELLAQDT